jgi:hypothetical protein
MYQAFSPKHATQYGLKEAVLISVLCSNIQQHPRHSHEGRSWTSGSVQSLAKLLPYFSVNTVRRLIDSLESQGVILKDNLSEDPMDRSLSLAFVDESAFGL